jgi:hypothetical protein
LAVGPQADQEDLLRRVRERQADPLLGQPGSEMPRDHDLEPRLRGGVVVGWL